MTKLIPPKILQGTRDFLPRDMAKRDTVMDKIKSVFIRFGYDTIETPAIEYASTLLGKYGDEGNKLIYRFRDNGDRDIALRYDQTVPFARLVAANYKELPMPFKRYQISKVWRADRPAKGRYREFTQCDIDIIGTRSLVAEAEVAQVISGVCRSLGFQNFVIKFNSRRLMNSILEKAGVPQNRLPDVIRALDKLEKIGRTAVEKELREFLDDKTIQKLMEVMLVDGSNKDKIRSLKGYSTEEIEEFLRLAANFGVPEGVLELDISLARGLDYYTGIIYEVFLRDVKIGAVCAGGRFDDLCGMFCEEKFSGVGVAFGFDRLMTALEELKMLEDIPLSAQALVTYFDDATLTNSLGILRELQGAGVNTEIYFEASPLARQFKYADKKSIPFVVIGGPDEVKRNEVTIKSMKTGKQKTVPRNQAVSYLTGYRS